MELYRSIVYDALEGLSAPTDEIEERFRQEQDRIESAVYRQLMTTLNEPERDAELREQFEEIAETVEGYQEAAAAYEGTYETHVKPYVREINSLANSGEEAVDYWHALIHDAIEELDFTKATVPFAESINEPNNPLFDSNRTYLENSRRLNMTE